MHSIPILFTFWPGLPQLWLYGRWSGLLKAIAFACFLNFVLYSTFQQNDLLSKAGLVGCWIALGLSWTVAIFHNDWVVKEFERSKGDRKSSDELDELFQMAQSEYLQGHLNEAENLLERILWLEPRDADARLYLATINRHRGKLHQASRQLDAMDEDPDFDKWRFQIEDERKLLAELESELDSGKAGEPVNLTDEPDGEKDTLSKDETDLDHHSGSTVGQNERQEHQNRNQTASRRFAA